ncbi:nuclear transport factor 2 family protein [Novosphingobium naphthalenivorans]|uniref:nuclear transport factor 2 family protein n=1 Tax=Novosphingobium naphthalenivorans TaxID=273168 RepID=UPI000830BBB5|nr:nuclear transport factor 2 family protein [Novosphingobium naphthalenivorans]
MEIDPLDYSRICHLMVRYSHAVDFGRPGDLAECFTADGFFEIAGIPSDDPLAGPFRGPEGLRRLCEILWDSVRGHGRHWVQPPLIESVGKDVVQTRTYVMFVRVGNVPAAGILSTGMYRDEFHMVDGRWLLASRIFSGDPQPGHVGEGSNPLIWARDDFVGRVEGKN